MTGHGAKMPAPAIPPLAPLPRAPSLALTTLRLRPAAAEAAFWRAFAHVYAATDGVALVLGTGNLWVLAPCPQGAP
jgi:hypothetical protein